MKSAVLEKPVGSGPLDADRVRAFLLSRIACAADGISRSALTAELAPCTAHRLPLAHWRLLVEREIEALCEAGLARIVGTRLEPSDAGIARAAIFLGLKSALPRCWQEVHDVHLMARALGLERQSGRRLAALATPDGLRAAIVERAFGLKIRGLATPSRLRAALAAVALERAFGNQIKPNLSGKLGLSAKAGRLLAGQLASKPRDFGTDARLIGALAAEHVGAAQPDGGALRLALLRGYLDGADKPPARPRPPARTPPLRPRVVASLPAPAPVRPDLTGFAHEVRQHAQARAQGWPGNRKAYISHVWHRLRERRGEWGLSEIEFKCMLIEAHRAGSLALAHADMKDKNDIAELQESAVVYKNAVFHFVRVDG
ncbi:MAG TPA: hypothetical protein VLL28_16050 [Hyphomicrobiaceae bacterium]|nr:hypothetical protein [Hyphomicrobiaceae bacterium]